MRSRRRPGPDPIHGVARPRAGGEPGRPGHPTSLVVHFDGTDDQVGALVVLARKEGECCPFFGFTIEVGAGEVTVRSDRYRPSATAVLDDLVALLV